MAFPFHLPAASPGSHRGKVGRIIGGIIHLSQPLPSAIFWSAALWEESVSGAAGTGRQRTAGDETGEEIRAGFFPGWKTVCPRIYPKCKLNIPLSSTKLWWMGGCAASWQAGKWWTRCLSLFLLSLSRQELLCLLESFSASIWDTLTANLDFTLRKERGDRPDSEPHVCIWKIILPNKISETAGLDSSWVQSPGIPAGAGWSDAFLDVYWAGNNLPVSQGKWRAECLGNWSSQGSSKQPQAHIRSAGSRRVCSGALRTWMVIPNGTLCRRGWMQEGRELRSLYKISGGSRRVRTQKNIRKVLCCLYRKAEPTPLKMFRSNRSLDCETNAATPALSRCKIWCPGRLGGACANSVWPDVREKLKVSYDLIGAVKLEFGPKAHCIEFWVLSICKK